MPINHTNNKFNRWDVAYRIGGCGGFKIVHSPSYGWAADPFLVEYNGEILLFAEIFLWKSERNGVIAYCRYKDGEFSEWIVTMDKHWHLSYPFVFTENNHLYMIPESYQLGEIALYELEHFPDNWTKVSTLISNVEYCDSTLFRYKNGKDYIITFERGEKSPEGRGIIFNIEGSRLSNKRIISDDIEGARCGGKIIEDNGNYLRVAQNCFPEYGKGLIIYEIDEVEPEYKEHELFRINAADIKGEFSKDYIGIHTYNRYKDIEVIDLKYVISSEEERMASDRVREVFLNKYR